MEYQQTEHWSSVRNHPEKCSAIGRAINQSEADVTSKKQEIINLKGTCTHTQLRLLPSQTRQEEKVIPNQYLYSSHTQRTNITQPTRQRRRCPIIEDQRRIICKKSQEEWITQVSTSLSTAGRTMEFGEEATQRQSATSPASNGLKGDHATSNHPPKKSKDTNQTEEEER